MKAFTLRDLPSEERPRERLIHYGVDVLSSQELLALILGRGIEGEPVMVTSQKLLAHFGSLSKLQDASFEDLCSIRGIGTAKACQLLAIFAINKRLTSDKLQAVRNKGKKKDIAYIVSLLQQKISDYSKEHVAVISLDTRHEVIGSDTIAIGILNANVVHPREIFEAAIRRHAASIIISHNHPSGNPEPSDDDIIVTKKLMEAGKLFGIPVIDHIIVTKNTYYSFSMKS